MDPIGFDDQSAMDWRLADMQRVMVGRIELIRADQRNGLHELAAASISDGDWIQDIPHSKHRERFLSGQSEFGDLGVTIPDDFRIYLEC